jgi:hypothetical protein
VKKTNNRVFKVRESLERHRNFEGKLFVLTEKPKEQGMMSAILVDEDWREGKTGDKIMLPAYVLKRSIVVSFSGYRPINLSIG